MEEELVIDVCGYYICNDV